MAIQINGNGTITGISNGGLPDGCILDADINGMAASKLTGALPAISGASLTNISTSSPTETYAHVIFGNTYDSNSGYVIHNITSVSGNGITGNTTNETLTPTVAGNYLVIYNCCWAWTYTGGTTGYSAIYKNGAQEQRSTFVHGSYGGTQPVMVMVVVSMNGSSDNISFYGYENRSNATAYMSSLSRAVMFLLKES